MLRLGLSGKTDWFVIVNWHGGISGELRTARGEATFSKGHPGIFAGDAEAVPSAYGQATSDSAGLRERYGGTLEDFYLFYFILFYYPTTWRRGHPSSDGEWTDIFPNNLNAKRILTILGGGSNHAGEEFEAGCTWLRKISLENGLDPYADPYAERSLWNQWIG